MLDTKSEHQLRLPRRLSAEEAFKLKTVNGIMLVDIRQPVEQFHTGIAEGADLAAKGSPSFLDYILEAVEGDKTRPIVLMCATGKRSADARALLEQNGFTNVADVSDGMLGNECCGPGWLKGGLPVKPFT